MVIQYLPISWLEYHTIAQHLAATVLSHDLHLDEIVAISRGGLTFGHLLSDFLRLPISTFSIQSYTNIQSQGEVKIVSELAKPVSGKRVLLVDDVADSGKTFTRAIKYLNDMNVQSVTTTAIFYKPHSSYRPDIFGRQTKKWILFPYEPTEMIKLISQKMEAEGKTKAQIQQFLTKLGYTTSQIAFVRKYHLT